MLVNGTGAGLRVSLVARILVTPFVAGGAVAVDLVVYELVEGVDEFVGRDVQEGVAIATHELGRGAAGVAGAVVTDEFWEGKH